MAFTGLRRQGYCVVDVTQNPDGTESEALREGKVFSKIMTVTSSPSSEETELYGDDGIAESEYSSGYGGLTIGVTSLTDEMEADLLGHTIEEGELRAKQGDTAPWVRCASLIPTVTNNVPHYKVIVFTRVKFAPTADDLQTKGKQMSYKTPVLESKFYPAADGMWRRKKTFDTFPEAEAYFNKALNITPGTPSAPGEEEDG